MMTIALGFVDRVPFGLGRVLDVPCQVDIRYMLNMGMSKGEHGIDRDLSAGRRIAG
jgi:hypothetical protein